MVCSRLFGCPPSLRSIVKTRPFPGGNRRLALCQSATPLVAALKASSRFDGRAGAAFSLALSLPRPAAPLPGRCGTGLPARRKSMAFAHGYAMMTPVMTMTTQRKSYPKAGHLVPVVVACAALRVEAWHDSAGNRPSRPAFRNPEDRAGNEDHEKDQHRGAFYRCCCRVAGVAQPEPAMQRGDCREEGAETGRCRALHSPGIRIN